MNKFTAIVMGSQQTCPDMTLNVRGKLHMWNVNSCRATHTTDTPTQSFCEGEKAFNLQTLLQLFASPKSS